MRWGSAYAFFACLACLISGPALAQNTTTGGGTPPAATPPATAAPTPAPGNQLPPVEVIQKQAQPAPKAVEKQAPAKKKTAQPAPQPAPPAPPPPQPTAVPVPGTGGIDTGTVMMSPVRSSIPIAKYPGAVGRASAGDVDRVKAVSAPELLQTTVPGAIISDAQGNSYQRDLQYRGFEASPVNGVAQGLAVYQNGVRINESFGDIVNWDSCPTRRLRALRSSVQIRCSGSTRSAARSRS
jgi:iron complex outermembrane recepter protein